MKNDNELIYYMRQIIGDEKENGFFTPVLYNDEIVNVPNFLFKDGPSEYPEIRISPFLSKKLKSHPIRVRGSNLDIKREFYDTVFQVDIYATNVVLANNIEHAINNRLDLFYDIDTIIYGYDKHFKIIDEEKNIYYHNKYNDKDFRIIDVYIRNFYLKRVFDKDGLNQKNTYYIDETGLYINTMLNIKMIQINAVLNGLIFPDGETAHRKGIIKTRILSRRNLSDLENNDVERISMDIGIFYRLDRDRFTGPIATDIMIDSD